MSDRHLLKYTDQPRHVQLGAQHLACRRLLEQLRDDQLGCIDRPDVARTEVAVTCTQGRAGHDVGAQPQVAGPEPRARPVGVTEHVKTPVPLPRLRTADLGLVGAT